MEESILERLSIRQFFATLTPAEIACVFATLLGYTQLEMSVIFADSPATICRTFKRIQMKYAAWNA